MVNEANHREAGIGDGERQRIFVTMHATFKDEEKCRVAMETIVNDAHAAYGVNSHFWFTSEDRQSLFVFEQYEDEGALRQAVRRFTSARVSFFRSIKVNEVAVHGDVSLVIKLMFSPLRPKYMRYYRGYSKSVAKAEEPGIKDFERKRIFIATSATSGDEQKTRQEVERSAENSFAASGINSHFWTRSNDGEAFFALEQYADEETLIDHLAANPTARDALVASMNVGDVTIYGAESDAVKEMLASLNPTYMNYYGGYSK